ncbi:MAG: DUF1538 domain-containing protein [Syntrophales bacterium]|jgi:hypothetical protein|nr:DUF1538 domain-containing protein [Syntrophales bacterium]NLN60053.1 DUF1538 domain-containing protein [Deltaproteobacteria bacterium]
MRQLLKEIFIEVIQSIAPLIVVVCILQFTLVKAPTPLFLQFLIGSLMAIGGLILFFLGIDIGILPMGKFIGAELPKRNSLMLIAGLAFALGFAATVAEPDVLVLSKQVDAISQGSVSGNIILYSMALGVGILVMIGMLRIVFGFSMVYLLAGLFTVILVLSFFTPAEFVPLAYDAGSVTTGALTAPVVISLALGLSSVLSGRSSVSEGFGLLGLASIGPIIIIMLLAIFIY